MPARAVAEILTDIHSDDGEVPLRCQQELHTQGFLRVPTSKNPEYSYLASVGAMQWVLLYLSISQRAEAWQFVAMATRNFILILTKFFCVKYLRFYAFTKMKI
jgi:hypothetical protein